MSDHAILSASGAVRWLTCTPSAMIEASLPEKQSKYAAEGTVAHSLAELFARRSLDRISDAEFTQKVSEIEANEYYTLEMRECATAYAKLVLERYTEACTRDEAAIVELETRVDYSDYAPAGFGTGDCIIISDGILDIIDFKYGEGRRVDVENNPQLKLYGLGAYETFKTLYEIDLIRMIIFQPRRNSKETVTEITAKELIKWGELVVKPRAKLAAEGKGDFAPSDNTCYFCKAKAECRARAKANLALFDDVKDPALMSLEEIGECLERAQDLVSWVNALKNKMFCSLLAGESNSRWKLVRGRSNRKIADEAKAVKALRKIGIKKAQMFESKLLSITQLEKAFGAKVIDTALGDLVIKPEGAPTLAAMADKRAMFTPTEELIKQFDIQEDSDE